MSAPIPSGEQLAGVAWGHDHGRRRRRAWSAAPSVARLRPVAPSAVAVWSVPSACVGSGWNWRHGRGGRRDRRRVGGGGVGRGRRRRRRGGGDPRDRVVGSGVTRVGAGGDRGADEQRGGADYRSTLDGQRRPHSHSVQYRREQSADASHPSEGCLVHCGDVPDKRFVVLTALGGRGRGACRRVGGRRRWRRRPDRVPAGARRFARRGRPGETCRDAARRHRPRRRRRPRRPSIRTSSPGPFRSTRP